MPHFKQMPMDPRQVMLFSQSVDDALPQDSGVRCFAEVMDCLDYSGLESKCCDIGCPPYPPSMMVKVLVYAYSRGIRSSRRIEELLRVDVRFLWLAGGLKPDHNTIARFRKDNSRELEGLFKDSVRICAETGLVFMNVLAVDGTKIESAASKRRIYDTTRVDRELAAVERILQEADEVDCAEDELYGSQSGPKMPPELADAAARKAKLQEISRRLKESKATSVVSTDVDSRVMKADEKLRPAYNVQAAVDGENQVVVAMQVTQSVKDSGMLPEMVNQSSSNVGVSPDVSLADAGYSSEETFRWIDEGGHKVLMKSPCHPKDKDPNNLFASRCFLTDAERDVLICPAGRGLTLRFVSRCGSGTYRVYGANGCQSCSFHRQCVGKTGSRRVSLSVVATQRNRMLEDLRSAEGHRQYALRQQIVEPVFGQMKFDRGFRRLTCWGLPGAVAESALMYLAHNVLKCAAKGRKEYLLLLLCFFQRGNVRPTRHMSHVPS
mgnify:CR=1 FL=1